MAYAIHIERRFVAAHALRLYDGSMEPLHSHEWKVEVDVAAQTLDEIDVVMDFHELQRIVDQAIAPLRGVTLNDSGQFASPNPSAERVAELLFKRIAAKLPPRVALSAVTVTEAPGCRARYEE